MRNFGIAMIVVAAGLAGIAPAAAAPGRGTIVNDGPYPLPEVRIKRPGSHATVGRQMRMGDRFDARDYRRDPVYPDRVYPDRVYPDRGGHDSYGHDDDYVYEDGHGGDRRQVEYGDARDIDYDRDYPYDHPYGGGQMSGGYGFGGYTVTETITTTTTPTIVKQIEYVDRPVAIHKTKRYKKTRRLHRGARRSVKTAARCSC